MGVTLHQWLLGKGYIPRQYQKEYGTNIITWSKDCGLQILKDLTGENIGELGKYPDNQNPNACILQTNWNEKTGKIEHVTLSLYSESQYRSFLTQLKSLGYKSVEHEEGNGGQDWTYKAVGKPNISIWNDYGDEYQISL